MNNEIRLGRAEVEIAKFLDNFRANSLSEAMKILAKEVRRQHCQPEDAISLRPLINNLGIDYRASKYNAIDLNAAASLRIKDGKFQILVNGSSHSHWRRVRFSIAHEIGHFMLIMYSGVNLTYDMQSFPHLNNILEDACDAFAQEILLPNEHLSKEISNVSEKGFLFIAKKYAVSEQVLFRAITDYLPGTSWIVLQNKPDELRSDIKSRVVFCYPTYKSSNPGCVWLPHNFGSNRISRSSDSVKMADYYYLKVQIKFNNEIKDLYFTHIERKRDLDILSSKRYNILASNIENPPSWIE